MVISHYTRCVKKGLNDNDSYIDIEIKDGKTPAIDGTEVSISTTKILPFVDERLMDILSNNYDTIPLEVLEYF